MTNTITSNPTAEKDLKKDLHNAKAANENVVNRAQDNYESLVEAENFLKKALNDLPNHYLGLENASNNNDGKAVKNEKYEIDKLWDSISETIISNPRAFINLLND